MDTPGGFWTPRLQKIPLQFPGLEARLFPPLAGCANRRVEKVSPSVQPPVLVLNAHTDRIVVANNSPVVLRLQLRVGSVDTRRRQQSAGWVRDSLFRQVSAPANERRIRGSYSAPQPPGMES